MKRARLTLLPILLLLLGALLIGSAGLRLTRHSDAPLAAPASKEVRPPTARAGFAVQPERPESIEARVAAGYSRLPLSFEPNRGQADQRVRFLARGPGYGLFLTSDEGILRLRSDGDEPRSNHRGAGDTSATRPSIPASRARPGLPGSPGSARQNGSRQGGLVRRSERGEGAVLSMKLVGANRHSQVTGLEELPGKSHYLIGKDPKKWRTDVRHYAKVQYQDVYPGIDLVYYGNKRQLEYDFVIAPGADPRAITLEIAGAGGIAPVSLSESGDLIIETGSGEVRFRKPLVYQPEEPGAQTPHRRPIDGHYVLLANNRVGFEVLSYDSTRSVVIDPVLEYATFLGGSGLYDEVTGIAVDASGNAYVAGNSEGADFPVTPGAFDETCGTDGTCNARTDPNERILKGASDVFVTKLSRDGSSLVYSTYVGGSSMDSAAGIAVDDAGQAHVTGRTWSPDFPTENPTQDEWRGGICGPGPDGYPCFDAFVTKLSPDGASLVYSTYLGGGGDEWGQGIALDVSGNAYVGGRTISTDFPTTPGAYQPELGGGTCGAGSEARACADVFVAKIDAAGSLVYSTYLGGSNEDSGWGFGVAVDEAGNAYVTSNTSSVDFPVTGGAFQSGLAGQTNAFVAKVDPSGGSLIYSTYLGGSDIDAGSGIALDAEGNAYLTGVTTSSDFPTTPEAFDTDCGTDASCNGLYDAYVSKLDPSGSTLVYSTYLGGSDEDYGWDIAVDTLGQAYPVGTTNSPDFPFKRGWYCGGGNAFMTKLTAHGEGAIVSTCLANGAGSGIALDSSRDAYVAGSAGWLLTTEGAFQTENAGGNDGFIVKLSDLAQDLVVLSADSLDFGGQLVGTTSAPQTVTLTNIGDADAPAPDPDLQITGDFQLTHTCQEGLAPGSSCSIDVTFTPSSAGTRTGEASHYGCIPPCIWQPFLSLTGVGIELAIDIKPGSDPNCFNLNGQGVIPVAILGSAAFDVANVDASTLVFNGLAVRVRGNKGPLCAIEDSNGDAFPDLVCHFEDDPESWTPGSTMGTVTGALLDGMPIEATDSICIVP